MPESSQARLGPCDTCSHRISSHISGAIAAGHVHAARFSVFGDRSTNAVLAPVRGCEISRAGRLMRGDGWPRGEGGASLGSTLLTLSFSTFLFWCARRLLGASGREEKSVSASRQFLPRDSCLLIRNRSWPEAANGYVIGSPASGLSPLLQARTSLGLPRRRIGRFSLCRVDSLRLRGYGELL